MYVARLGARAEFCWIWPINPPMPPLHQFGDADPTLFLTHQNGSVELEPFRFHVEMKAGEGIEVSFEEWGLLARMIP